MDQTTTNKLADILSNIDDTKEMEEFMEQPKVTDGFKTFCEYFRSLSSVKDLSDSELIKRSGIERSYYYQIIKGTRNPGRDKVIRMCLAAGLSLKETTRALELAGCAVLYPKNRRDIILTVAINQNASVDETNFLLDKYQESALE